MFKYRLIFVARFVTFDMLSVREKLMKNYISRLEADELCDGLIRQFIGPNATIPQSVDIDAFVTQFLKINVRYEKFAEPDLDKIGFCSDGITPLQVLEQGRVVKCVYPHSTIILERFLLRPGEEHRRRFTLAHEAGHVLAAQIDPESSAHFYRVQTPGVLYTAEELHQRLCISEWQANILAAALLMPRFIVKDALIRFNNGRRLPIYGEHVFRPQEKVILQKMSDALGVSHTALVIRLRDLGALRPYALSQYISNELRLGGA